MSDNEQNNSFASISNDKIVVNKLDETSQQSGGNSGVNDSNNGSDNKYGGGDDNNSQEGGDDSYDESDNKHGGGNDDTDEFMNDTEFGVEPLSDVDNNAQSAGGNDNGNYTNYNVGNVKFQNGGGIAKPQLRNNNLRPNNNGSRNNSSRNNSANTSANNGANNGANNNMINKTDNVGRNSNNAGRNGSNGSNNRNGRNEGGVGDSDRIVVDNEGNENDIGHIVSGKKTMKAKSKKSPCVSVVVPAGGRAVVPFKLPTSVDLATLRTNFNKEYKNLVQMKSDKRSQRIAELDATLFEDPAADDYIKGMLPVLDNHALKLLALKSVMISNNNKNKK